VQFPNRKLLRIDQIFFHLATAQFPSANRVHYLAWLQAGANDLVNAVHHVKHILSFLRETAEPVGYL
jgi:hypothetical protein